MKLTAKTAWRAQQAFDFRISGYSLDRIAKFLNISVTYAHMLIAAHVKQVNAGTKPASKKAADKKQKAFVLDTPVAAAIYKVTGDNNNYTHTVVAKIADVRKIEVHGKPLTFFGTEHHYPARPRVSVSVGDNMLRLSFDAARLGAVGTFVKVLA